jgi:hypothetical protein
MLFQQRFLDGIRSGSITLAFRRWRRPSVRSGGTLLTPIGQLGIASVAEVSIGDISEVEARCAGYESLDALRAALGEGMEGRVYRIELGQLRADPRVALRESAALTDDERRDLAKRLARLDEHAEEPWTSRVLHLNPSSRESIRRIASQGDQRGQGALIIS